MFNERDLLTSRHEITVKINQSIDQSTGIFKIDSVLIENFPELSKYFCSFLYRRLKTMLQAILNKSWKQHHTKQQLYGHIPPISTTIQIRRTRHAGHCWRITDELISKVLLWTPSHRRASVGRPARTYQQQLWMDTRWCLEDLLEAMDDRDEWRERERERERGGEEKRERERELGKSVALAHDNEDLSHNLVWS